MLEELDVYHMLIHPAFFTRFNYELTNLPEYVMLFTVEPALRRDSDFRFRLKLNKDNLDFILPFMINIINEILNRNPESQVVVNSLTLYIISLLCRHYRECYNDDDHMQKRSTPQLQNILKCLQYIYTNYSETIVLDDLLKATDMPKTTFLRLFRNVTGSSPMEFIYDYRINISKRLLLTTNKTITEIGASTGFYDTSHFSHLFKKQTNLTPKDFRNIYYR